VFIPVLFMGGVLGRLFREFSVTICVAILISGVVSVTLTPMLCSRFLKKPKHGHGSQGSQGSQGSNRFYDATERAFQSLLNGYDRTLQVVLRHRAATMAAFRRGPAGDGCALCHRAKGFIPDQDTDQIAITTEAAQGTAYDKLVEYQGQVADLISPEPQCRRARLTHRRQRRQHARRPEPRQIVVTLSESRTAGAGRRHHQDAAATAGDHSGHEGLHAESADESGSAVR